MTRPGSGPGSGLDPDHVQSLDSRPGWSILGLEQVKSQGQIMVSNSDFGISNHKKMVKMTKSEKSRILSLIKLGYFLSLLRFSDLKSDIKSRP